MKLLLVVGANTTLFDSTAQIAALQVIDDAFLEFVGGGMAANGI